MMPYFRYVHLVVFTQWVILSGMSSANNDTVFSSIFSAPYQVSYLNVTNGYQTSLPLQLCSGMTWNYTFFIPTGNNTSTYRVPHSRIYVDGKKCGDLPDNATMAQLWLDNYMLLASSSVLTSQSAAANAQAGSLYFNLFQLNDRHGLCQVTYTQAVQRGEPVWLGYEEVAPRVCGGVQIFPQSTYILFSQTGPSSRIDISQVYQAGVNVTLQEGEEFQIVFDEPFNRSAKNPGRVCPAVQKELSASADGAAASPSPSHSSSSFLSCFPSTAKVTLTDNSTIPIARLALGSRILDPSGKFSEVFMFTHRDISPRLHAFLRFETNDGRELVISHGHYVYTPEGLTMAAGVGVGSRLVIADGSITTVTKRDSVYRQGLFNPQTVSGSLVIDGFAVSAYTAAVEPNVAHVLLSPLRFLSQKSWGRGMVFRVFGHLFHDGAKELSWLLWSILRGSVAY